MALSNRASVGLRGCNGPDVGVTGPWLWARLEGVVRGIGLDDPERYRAEFIPGTRWGHDVALGDARVSIDVDDVVVRDGMTASLRERFAVPEGARFGAADDQWL